MIWRTALALAMLTAVSNASQITSPGITILVLNETLTLAKEVDVEVHDLAGTTVLAGKTTNGAFEIADLGFGPHSVIVGRGTCGEVRLNNIYFYLDAHPVFRVVRNRCPNGGDGYGFGCEIRFRIRDNSGKALPGAAILARASGEKIIADAFGRAVAKIGRGRTETFEISSPGYPKQSEIVECKRYEIFQKEIHVLFR